MNAGMINFRRACKILTIFVGVVSIVTALYIMLKGLGLQDSLDFGAGAYYYADIPEFQEYTEKTHFAAKLPFWVYMALFLAWGALMYWLWKYIDKK